MGSGDVAGTLVPDGAASHCADADDENANDTTPTTVTIDFIIGTSPE